MRLETYYLHVCFIKNVVLAEFNSFHFLEILKDFGQIKIASFSSMRCSL